MVAPLLLVLAAPVTLAATALVLVAAAHVMLAKHLYATGWGAGAQVMYYGGDVIEVALTALLCREWLAPARRPKLALSTAHQG
jgi:cytochrome c oxidase assembly factor CtaG